MEIINTTPHGINFINPDGSEFTVPPCGVVINAQVNEKDITKCHPFSLRVETIVNTYGLTIVTPTFKQNEENEKKLSALEFDNPNAIIVGSIIAAQAYPGRVFAMVPAQGFERVPPNEKKMRSDKFSSY